MSEFVLEPGAEHKVTFLVCWHFAGGEHGRMYANWYRDAHAIAQHLQKNLDPLTGLTHSFATPISTARCPTGCSRG